MDLQKHIEILENIPFWKHLGITVRRIDDGYAELRLPFKQELEQLEANMHGGALASLLDVAGAVALRARLGQAKINTAELKINYLKPVTSHQTEVLAYGRVVHAGRTLGVCSVEVTDGEGTMVSTGIATFVILSRDADSC